MAHGRRHETCFDAIPSWPSRDRPAHFALRTQEEHRHLKSVSFVIARTMVPTADLTGRSSLTAVTCVRRDAWTGVVAG